MANEIPLSPCPIHGHGPKYPKKTRGAGAEPRNTRKRKKAQDGLPIASGAIPGTYMQLEIEFSALINP